MSAGQRVVSDLLIQKVSQKEESAMLFSGIPFLFYFLPAVVLVYSAVASRHGNLVLLISSLIFYAWGEPVYVLLMLGMVITGYIFGLLIERSSGHPKLSRLYMVISVIISLAVLGYFKYADFFIANFNAATGLSLPLLRIALPIGISFYTFQIISYTADVYRGNVSAQKSFVDFAAYVTFFPQLIAGPVVRYSDIEKQLTGREQTAEKILTGIRRFIIGLAKKILIANQLGELCGIFRASGEKSILFFWLYAAACVLNIYFDFSGYSDMAIGLGRIFGFEFPENFNYPYTSGSITEFWRRWHISLGSWFRDYVYIPLGGNRVGKLRHIFNIAVVWMLTGLWHGASWIFVIWGLYFAVLLIFEKYFMLKILNKSKVLNHIYVLFFITVSFVLFDSADLSMAASYIGGMFGAGGYPAVSDEALYYLRSYGVTILIGIIGSTPLIKRAGIWLSRKLGSAVYIIEPVLLCALLLICSAYLADGSYNPFLYFRF